MEKPPGNLKIITPKRSEGDGMENSHPVSNEVTASFNDQPSFVNFYNTNFLPGKAKEPKFVPYEPYKAAVNPILLNQNSIENVPVINSQKVNQLASSVMKQHSASGVREIPRSFVSHSCDCGNKVYELEERIRVLETERKELAADYQVQIKVNEDLKKLLVASVGEDVELRVSGMSSDRAMIGMELLQLTTQLHVQRDELEKRSAQRDVFESKFRATSIIAQELAQQKVSLSKKLNKSTSLIQSLLVEHKMIYDQLSATYRFLGTTLNALGSNSVKESNFNTVGLSKEIKSFSNELQLRLTGKKLPDAVLEEGLRQYTPAEHTAAQVCNQLVDQLNKSSQSEFPEGNNNACKFQHQCSSEHCVNFCKQCCGEIKTI